MIRVVHLSVVHRPDDPRIYERECRSLRAAGYAVMYLAPGAQGQRDEYGVLLSPLPPRPRATRLLSSFNIAQALRILKPHVLHVHDPELLTLFPMLRGQVPRLVYDMHEYLPQQIRNKPYIPSAARPLASQVTAAAQKRLAAVGDGVIVVTPQQLEALGDDPELRLVLPNYPRAQRFTGAEPLPGLSADPRLKLVYVGSLSRSRGCLMMLDVMERLAADEAVLYLGGPFASVAVEQEIRARVEGSLADRVVLFGRIPPTRFPGYLAAADVVWSPTLAGPQYSMPSVDTKIYEGMAAGLAILATDLPGRGDIVRDERCGLAVPSGTDGHLAGVRRLLGDREAVKEMGERGRRAVARTYSWEAIAGDLIGFYESLCSGLPES